MFRRLDPPRQAARREYKQGSKLTAGGPEAKGRPPVYFQGSTQPRTRPMPCSSRLAALCVLLALPAVPVLGQTTPTERAAAGDVLRQIDGRQARLRPADLGSRLAARNDAGGDNAVARAKVLWEHEMERLSEQSAPEMTEAKP